ncbi:MAG: ribonuclease HII [Candidatus Nanoarchaeia archaeon]
MKVCGIDEAGRGCVIGPLVIAAYCIDEDQLAKLEKLKIKESKQLSPRQRQIAFKKLMRLSKNYKISVISAQEIDSRANVGLNINQLEALKISELIDELAPDIVYIDSPTSPDSKQFEIMIRKNLAHQYAKIISEHKADTKFPIVAAASILAKVTRDEEIEIIKKEIGINFGSGYPADPLTINFLKKNWENPSIAKYIRKSWGTIKELEKLKGQKTLAMFED